VEVTGGEFTTESLTIKASLNLASKFFYWLEFPPLRALVSYWQTMERWTK
jgi:hypothetical protein